MNNLYKVTHDKFIIIINTLQLVISSFRICTSILPISKFATSASEGHQINNTHMKCKNSFAIFICVLVKYEILII